MKRFSKYFRLGKTQAELDFVDVPVDGDVPLFVDPFAISQRTDRWSEGCHRVLLSFFDRIVGEIRGGAPERAMNLLRHLREPNETRLGLSRGRPRGAGIGEDQSRQIFEALRDSAAVKTGFLSSLEECELMIDGIGRDKISDLTTNILRARLADYTHEQCVLHGIPTAPVSLGPCFEADKGVWLSRYLDLPTASGRPLLLVPKAIARFDPAYDHRSYYRDVALEYLQAEYLSAHSSLVTTLKNGNVVVYKKDVEKIFPCTKDNLFKFSRDHPEALHNYREELARLERLGPTSLVEPEDEALIAKALSQALDSIEAGSGEASAYHNLMIGVVEFLFFPTLLYPRKEKEIHEGRKRIDIVMENGARSGIFHLLHAVRELPCAFVAFECKNYTTDVANPELDQLGGRFSPNRGRIGFLCCRAFGNRELFVKRCRDTFKDDRGLVVPIDDRLIKRLLELIGLGQRENVDRELARAIDEIWYS